MLNGEEVKTLEEAQKVQLKTPLIRGSEGKEKTQMMCGWGLET